MPKSKKKDGAASRNRSANALALMETAIMKNTLDGVRRGLDNGISPDDLLPHYPSTALGMAAQEGNFDIVRLLLDRGANVNQTFGQHNATALSQACQTARSAVVRLLIESRADIHFSGHSCLENLIETSGEMNEHLIPARSMQEINDERTAIAKLLLGPQLRISLGTSTRASLESQLSLDGDFTVSDALYCGASAGWLWMVELCIQHNADIFYTKSNGAHPLYIACKAGATDCASALVAAKANPNQPKAGGWSSLLLAVQGNHIGCVRVLLAAKADVDHRIDPIAQNGGRTTCALMHACIAETGFHECLEVLLEARADPDRACVASGTTALFNASLNGWTKCAALLETYGARRYTPHQRSAGRMIEIDQQQARPAGHEHLADWTLDTADWVTPLHFWPVASLPRIRAMLREGWDVYACLKLPPNVQDARRDHHPVPMADAKAWLAGKRVEDLWPSQAVPPRPGGNRSEVEAILDDDEQVTAKASLLVEACEWSPKSHEYFPAPMRARACDLLWLGHLLARTLEAQLEAAAFDEVVAGRAVELGLLSASEVDALTDGIAKGELTARELLRQHRPAVATADPAWDGRVPHFSTVALLDVWRDRIMPQALRRDDPTGSSFFGTVSSARGSTFWYEEDKSEHEQEMQGSLSHMLYASRRRYVRWLLGTTVVIRRVKSATHGHLNGTVGVVAKATRTDTGRWPIRTCEGVVLAMRPENLASAGLQAFRCEPLEPGLAVLQQSFEKLGVANAAKALYDQGAAAWRSGEHKRAVELITEAIDAYAPQPAPSEYYVNRASLFKDHFKMHEKALADAERAVELDPTWIDVHIIRGAVLHDMCAAGGNWFAEAQASYARALAMNPDHPEVHRNLQLLATQKAKQIRAKRAANATADALYQQGAVATRAGDHARSIELFSEAIDACTPDCAPAAYHQSRSNALEKLGKHKEALADADRAIELEPDWAGGYVCRGNTLGSMCKKHGANQWAGARAAYEHVLAYETDPTKRDMMKRLIVALRVEEARALRDDTHDDVVLHYITRH